MMAGFGFVGFFLMLVFWGIVIAGAVWLMRSIFPGASISGSADRPTSTRAREILDQRYARGEITREHYLAMVKDLESIGK
jgi:putative membrane protein